MRLIGYGPGEICDRLSILALKILHANGQPTEHFREEQAALVRQSREAGWLPYWDGFPELAAVNAEIWRLGDALRAYQIGPTRAGDAEGVLLVATRQQQLNDRRAALIAEINQQAGHVSGPEKL
jgi:hypothetical protein